MHNSTHRGHTLTHTQLTINGLGTLGVRGWAGCMGVDEDLVHSSRLHRDRVHMVPVHRTGSTWRRAA